MRLMGRALALSFVALAVVPASAQRIAPASSPANQPISHAQGRLTARDIGLIINTADPYSVAVGEHYIVARQLQPQQVLRVELPSQARLDELQFERLRQAIAGRFGARTQALALAWRQPFAVGCNSITGALALGYDAALCMSTCRQSRQSAYFNAATASPWSDLSFRPSMLLAAGDAESAMRMIDRGVASDGSQGLRGAPPAEAWFVITGDAARNVRAAAFPPNGAKVQPAVDIHVAPEAEQPSAGQVILYLTGRARVDRPESISWAPGALADHLTSFGGALDQHGQMPVTDWIDAGVTASYGTVSEPCNHVQKFPQPQVLLGQYLQGVTAIEAYWKSVEWPQQGLFIGEPLAAPYTRGIRR